MSRASALRSLRRQSSGQAPRTPDEELAPRVLGVSGSAAGSEPFVRLGSRTRRRGRRDRRPGSARSVRGAGGELVAAVGLGDLAALGQPRERGGHRRAGQPGCRRDLAGGQWPLGRRRRQHGGSGPAGRRARGPRRPAGGTRPCLWRCGCPRPRRPRRSSSGGRRCDGRRRWAECRRESSAASARRSLLISASSDLADLAIHQGELDEARSLCAESLAVLRRSSSRPLRACKTRCSRVSTTAARSSLRSPVSCHWPPTPWPRWGPNPLSRRTSIPIEGAKRSAAGHIGQRSAARGYPRCRSRDDERFHRLR
jgi:hypothetical protein